MKYNKWVALLTALLAFSATLSASDTTTLFIQVRDGSTRQYLLSSKPVITFQDNLCHVNGDGVSADFDMADIEYVKILENSSVSETINDIKIDLRDPNFVKIFGLPEGENITLYNLNGFILKEAKSDSFGFCELEIHDLSTGVYIITSKKSTFKIYKK